MSATVTYEFEPHPRQAVALGMTSPGELLYGGAAGGGKSRWARAEAIRLCLQVPGSKAILFRRSFPDLERAVVDYFRAEMPKGVGAYNIGKHIWRFANGSTLELAFLEKDSDVYNYQGAEYQLAIFEELTQFTEAQYRYILGRLRAVGEVKRRMAELGIAPRAISTSNPGGIGHHWVKARWVDHLPHGKPFTPEPDDLDPDPLERCYIPALVSDNYSLDQAQYIKQLNSQDPTMRRALLEGDWDILEGVRFTQWRKNVHVYPANTPGLNLEILAGYPRACAVDWGMEDPFCCLWGAKLPDGLIVIYRELYQKNVPASQQARMIAEAEADGERMLPQRPLPLSLDPSMWRREVENVLKPLDKDAPPIGSAAWYYSQQFPGQVKKAINDRINGWALVDEHLRVRDDGLPRLIVLDNCPNLIRTLPALPRAKTNPNDVDTHAEDHAPDTLRYLLMDMIGPKQVRTAEGSSGYTLPPGYGRNLSESQF